MSEGKYRNGSQESAWIYYNEKGEIINLILYQDGEFVISRKNLLNISYSKNNPYLIY